MFKDYFQQHWTLILTSLGGSLLGVAWDAYTEGTPAEYYTDAVLVVAAIPLVMLLWAMREQILQWSLLVLCGVLIAFLVANAFTPLVAPQQVAGAAIAFICALALALVSQAGGRIRHWARRLKAAISAFFTQGVSSGLRLLPLPVRPTPTRVQVQLRLRRNRLCHACGTRIAFHQAYCPNPECEESEATYHEQ